MTTPTDDAWDRVREQFRGLADDFRRHYEQVQKEEGADRKTSDAVSDALRTLADAADQMASTAGNALRDDQVRRDAGEAGRSLIDAMGQTFSRLGDQLKRKSQGR